MKRIEAFTIMLATAIAVYIAVNLFSINSLYALTSNSTPIDGTVVEKRAEKHKAIQYAYDVDGKEYYSVGSAGDIGKDFAQIQIGDQVPVYYDHTNPENSTMGDPRPILKSNLNGAILFSLIPTILYLGYRAQKKWWPR